MTLRTVDAVVIAAYLVGVVGLGCWFVRSSRTTQGFMVAAGRLPGWVVGLSILGTYLSSTTFLFVPGKAYATNWNAFAFSLSLPLAAWIATRWFVPFHRNCGSVSAYDHLEERFGPWARTYGVACYLLTQLARVGAVLFGVSLIMATLTGWSQATIIITAGVLVTLYTAMGGIEAVIWTDVVQSVVLSVGAVTLLVLLVLGMPEGPSQAWRIATADDKLSLGGFAFDFTRSTFWVPLLYGLFENLKNFGIDQSYVQRYHTAATERQAENSVWIGALLYLPLSAVFFAIGTLCYTYYQAHPSMLLEVQVAAAERLGEAASAVAPSDLTAAQVGDSVLPHFIVHGLPTGATGLIIAAIFAAAMSSIDTSLNSAATVTLLDLYKRRLRPDVGERESMIVLYATTALMGAVGVGVALAMIGVNSALDTWWKLSGIFAGGLLGLFLLGVLAKRAKRPAALCGVIIGVLVILWMSLPDLIQQYTAAPAWVLSPLHAHMTIVVGTLTVFLVGVAVSRVSSFIAAKP
ncbi:Sodium/glucose cotransporter [Botrimarina colliarenosi]|uniref:Sodium/glucose cotransporter n=1 Tax=Botrimarina colliarenosi TaxID=2528001 RepID=A0A5C6ADK8_9BACT|nr:sodium:solute symporter [Botrimarina colliarenosi]TWT97699.1 Sodium/glucose cotransporter [Botrimarina colliarenosi]